MELLLGAKSTKPGSKATAKRGSMTSSGYPARVPVGTLHLIDNENQTEMGGFTAVCGEGSLMSIDGEWEDEFPNERCEPCAEAHWVASFDTMQRALLQGK